MARANRRVCVTYQPIRRVSRPLLPCSRRRALAISGDHLQSSQRSPPATLLGSADGDCHESLTIAKLIPLFLLIVVGVFFIDPHRYSTRRAAVLRLFLTSGAPARLHVHGIRRRIDSERRNARSERHLPFALLTGFDVVTLVYVSVQIVCIGTLPGLAVSQRPLADAGVQFLGEPGCRTYSVGALVSMAGTLNALMFATPRLLFAMSENGQLPAVFLRRIRDSGRPCRRLCSPPRSP